MRFGRACFVLAGSHGPFNCNGDRKVAVPMETQVNAGHSDGGPDLVDLAATLHKKWYVVAAVCAAFVLAMVIYLNMATYRYTATMTVTSAQNSGGGLSGSLSKLGGLASIAGVQLPQDSGSVAFIKFGENLRSRTAADILSKDPAVMRKVFEREWNAADNRWAQPPSALRAVVNGIKIVLGIPVYAWKPPGPLEMQDYLERHVSVVQDPKKPLMTISFSHSDPVFARAFVKALHDAVDGDLRARTQERAAENITYLSRKINEVPVVEHRLALTEALGEQERLLMTASSTAPFAADPISAISISRRPTSPRPVLYLAGALFFGLVVGVCAVLTRAYLQSRATALEGLN